MVILIESADKFVYLFEFLFPAFAGMGNLDIMTATLDRQRHRRPTMMSVNRVSMNRLQNLMRSHGRRRK